MCILLCNVWHSNHSIFSFACYNCVFINGDFFPSLLLLLLVNVQELDALPSACHNGEVNDILIASSSKTLKSQDSAAVTFSPKLEFDDADIDDDLDPAMKEELDRLDGYARVS